MLKQKQSKKGSLTALLCIAGLLLLVILLENLNLLLPSTPAILLPTSQLFTVLKKAAVYSLVAVSMNLLNGFTGLFSLGQAGFMLLGAYTYGILMVPLAARIRSITSSAAPPSSSLCRICSAGSSARAALAAR